jgi:hypothetical protein
MTNNKSSELILYKTSDGAIKIDMILEDETVWLAREQMAELFGKARTTVTGHIQNIFKEAELDPTVVCRNSRIFMRHYGYLNIYCPTLLRSE